MRLASLLAATAATLPVVLSCAAGADPLAPSTKTFGYFNPQTHVFTPAQPAAPNAAGPAATTIVRSGTVNVSVTVRLVSPIPKDAIFSTGAGVLVGDPDTATLPRYVSSVGDVAPTVTRSGRTLKITASIPYRFVYTVSTDQMLLSFYISYNGPPPHSFFYNQSIKIPANGATTPISLTASL